jgi:hypothetical protein
MIMVMQIKTIKFSHYECQLDIEFKRRILEDMHLESIAASTVQFPPRSALRASSRCAEYGSFTTPSVPRDLIETAS